MLKFFENMLKTRFWLMIEFLRIHDHFTVRLNFYLIKYFCFSFRLFIFFMFAFSSSFLRLALCITL